MSDKPKVAEPTGSKASDRAEIVHRLEQAAQNLQMVVDLIKRINFYNITIIKNSSLKKNIAEMRQFTIDYPDHVDDVLRKFLDNPLIDSIVESMDETSAEKRTMLQVGLPLPLPLKDPERREQPDFMLDDEGEAAYRSLANLCLAEASTLVVLLAEKSLNRAILMQHSQEFTQLKSTVPKHSYENKKEMVSLVNGRLKELCAAIAHPDTDEPCILLAVGSPDGYGRYLLENKKTKKRSHTCSDIRKFLPFKLLPDVVRKEGVSERRKRKQKEEGGGR